MSKWVNGEKLLEELDKAKQEKPRLNTVKWIHDHVTANEQEGKWVKVKTDVLSFWACSVCQDCFFIEEPNARYCPHCGAPMSNPVETGKASVDDATLEQFREALKNGKE